MTPFILVSVGVIGVAGLVFWPQIERLLNPVPKPVPGRDAAGADEKFPAELRAMREATIRDEVGQQLLANLRTSALEEVAAHEGVAQTIDALCDDLMVELAAICDKILTAAKTCDRRHTRELRLDPRGRAWLAAELPCDTGEYPAVEMSAR